MVPFCLTPADEGRATVEVGGDCVRAVGTSLPDGDLVSGEGLVGAGRG